MNEIPSGYISVFMGFVVILVGFGVAWGVLFTRVNGHEKDIEDEKTAVAEDRRINREDHRVIMQKMDTLTEVVLKGKE